MEKIAPFADISIPLSLGSVTGLKYKTINCMECGNPILERNGEKILRVRQNSYPDEARLSADGTIPVICSSCAQKYSLTFSVTVGMSSSLPLYMQPQSIYMAIEPHKKLRDVYCMECGKAFYSISDRINLVSDNVIPFDMLDPAKMGPMEVWCKFHHCKQRWSVMA
jgi:hypothetical protein